MSKERPINVGTTERIAAAALAGVLLAKLLRRPRLFGLLALGCLVYRATQGHCYGYQWIGFSTCPIPRPPA